MKPACRSVDHEATSVALGKALREAPIARVVTSSGSLEIRVPRAGIVIQRVVGHGSREIAQGMADNLERLIARYGSLHVFDDWAELGGYDSDARLSLTEFVHRRRREMPVTHVLSAQRMVLMGLAVAGMTLGMTIHTHRDRRSFDAVLDAALSS